jgi:hypothetical protein
VNIAAPASFLTESTALLGGQSNAGIFKHTMAIPGHDTSFALVEKRMLHHKTFKDEFELCKDLSEQGRAGIQLGPLPAILSTAEDDGYYTILMQYYSGTGVQLPDWAGHARLIARSVAALNAVSTAVPERNVMTEVYDRVRQARIRTSDLATFAEAVLQLRDMPLPDAWKDEIVKSHNDLYFPNIATEPYRDTYNIVYIDLGMVALNHIGADFHHFVRASVLDKCPARMYRVMVDEYSAVTGRPKGLIELNAYRFALLRMASRGVTFEARKRPKELAKELAGGYRILSKVRALLQKNNDVSA